MQSKTVAVQVPAASSSSAAWQMRSSKPHMRPLTLYELTVLR